MYKVMIPFLLFLVGCASTDDLPSPSKFTDCLSAQFFNRTNETEFITRDSKTDKIISVTTPAKRKIDLQEKFTLLSFESIIHDPNAIDKYKALFSCFPSLKTWEQLRPYLKASDDIRLIPGLDYGFAVIRDNHLFCMIITKHSP